MDEKVFDINMKFLASDMINSLSKVTMACLEINDREKNVIPEDYIESIIDLSELVIGAVMRLPDLLDKDKREALAPMRVVIEEIVYDENFNAMFDRKGPILFRKFKENYYIQDLPGDDELQNLLNDIK